MPYELTVQGDHYFLLFVDAMTQADLERLPDEVKALEDRCRMISTGSPTSPRWSPSRSASRTCMRSPPGDAPGRFAIRDPVAVGFARMFQTLNDNPQIEIRIVPPLEAARVWIAEPRPARTE
jgi:hypothetical protein